MKQISKPIVILDPPHVNIPFHVGLTSGRIISITETHVFLDFNKPVLAGWFALTHPISDLVLDNINPTYLNILHRNDTRIESS